MLEFGLMGLLGNPENTQECEDGEDGFLLKSKPLSPILGDDCENGLLAVGLAMGLRGEGGEGIAEDVDELLERRS